MKSIKSTYLIILIASLVFLFEGCKKDDDPSPAEQLVGSWKEVSYVSTGCTDPSDNESGTCTTKCETLVATSSTLTFGSDPALSYTASGNTLTVTIPGQQSVTVVFAITGSTLTFAIQDSPADGGCKSVSTYSKI